MHSSWSGSSADNGGSESGEVCPIRDSWKYQLTPTAGQYSAQFAYDGVGRCSDVYKLQSTTTTPCTYVHTVTSYGSNGSPTWGQASQVIEDSGGINRTTNTLAYTSWGKACQVQDAAGHQFTTSFDLDGNVQSVTRTDSNLNQTIASYTYGTSGISNGQPTSITDGLSGVSDSIVYQSTGPGVGQVASTSETNGASSYSVSYVYNSTGDRWKTTYSTPNGVTQWQYDDYETLGPTSTSHRVFQTLTKLVSGQPSAEQFQYVYDASGALRHALFAQTPAAGFTPSSGNPWYDATHYASTRARAYYAYDSGGRITGVSHWWDTWNSGNSSYSSEAVLDNECAYEYSGVNRGLKTSSSFYKNTSPGSPNWTLDHTETYSYDPNLDYLTGANYGDGLPNATAHLEL